MAENTDASAEIVSRVLTWAGDEKILLVLAAAWIASRGRSRPLQRAGNHALLVTIAASLLPHALKSVFDQTRPDCRTIVGQLHGIPFSEKREDAFRPCAPHGSAGVRSRHVAARPTAGDPNACDRSFSDPHCGLGALGERRRRGVRARGCAGAAAAMDRLSGLASKEDDHAGS